MSSAAQQMNPNVPGISPYTSQSYGVGLGLLDLPIEAQTEIVGHASRATLKSLQLVSKHFHGLASARLYSRLAFLLTPPESQFHYSSPAYRLGDALHTFATSDHDYAQYVKSFGVSLLEHDAEDVQKKAVSRFHHQEEATKLLNTTLMLVIRKAKALESFDWDVPVELSGQVYSYLGKIPSLQELSIHLDTAAVPKAAYSSYPGGIPGMPPVVGQQPPTVFGGGALPHPVPHLVPHNQTKGSKAYVSIARGGRRKFSSLGNLRKFNVTGIESLDCLGEISTCMRQCSISLKNLSLSLSPYLARKAHKSSIGAPNSNVPVDPLDDEDDATTQPATPLMTTTTPPQPTEADVKRERKIQESILGRIFGFETLPSEDKKVDKSLKAAASKMQPSFTQDEQFLQHLKTAVTAMAKNRSATGAHGSQTQSFFSKLEKAVDKYLQSTSEKKKKKPSAKPPVTNKSKPAPPPSHDFGSQTLPQSQYLGSSNLSLGLGEMTAGLNQMNQMNTKLNQDFLDIFGTETPTMQDLENFVSVNYPLGSAGHSKKPASGYLFPTGAMPGPSSFPSGNVLSEANSNQLNAFFGYNAQNSPVFGLHDMSKLTKSQKQALLSEAAASKAPNLGANYASKWTYPDNFLPPPPSKGAGQMSFVAPGGNGANVTQENLQNGAEQAGQTESESSSSEEEGEKAPNDTSNPPVSAPVDSTEVDEEDDMDVDMEHPDIVEDDSDGDQDMPLASPESSQIPSVSPGPETSWTYQSQAINEPLLKGKDRVTFTPKPTPGPTTTSSSNPTVEQELNTLQTKATSIEETIRDYIRINHGFRLESLDLYLVPLRPSVLAKALDLSCLRSISLLSVGPQGSFWKLVEKYQDERVPINFRSIHTDDVSLAFLTCVSKLSGLEELYMMRRNNSKDVSYTTTKAPAPLEEIRRLALRKQLSTLQRLAIVSEEESWDLDGQCIRLIAAKGKVLRELAFGIDLNDYHTFLQCLPGLQSLVAINLMTIRTGDRVSALNRESRKFLLDVCHYCPHLRLKYIGMSGIVYEIGRRHKAKAQKEADKDPSSDERVGAISTSKGKGKAKAVSPDVNAHEEEQEEESLSDIELGSPEVGFVKHHKFSDVPGISIFDRKIRKART